MTGTTDFAPHTTDYWGLFINESSGIVYANSGVTGGSSVVSETLEYEIKHKQGAGILSKKFIYWFNFIY